MKKLSKEEVIKNAQEYIDNFIITFNENKNGFRECNKQAIADFQELQGYMSIYKYGAEEYKEVAYRYIKAIFG